MDSPQKVEENIPFFSGIINWFQTLSNFEVAALIVSVIVVLFIIIRFFGAFIFEFLGEILSALD